MRQKSVHPELSSERIVKNIRRATRKRHSSEEKIRIVLDGLRGESSIAELCRREGYLYGFPDRRGVRTFRRKLVDGPRSENQDAERRGAFYAI